MSDKKKKLSPLKVTAIGGAVVFAGLGITKKFVSEDNRLFHIANGPRFGGVVILDNEGKKIPEAELKNKDIKDFLIRLLEDAKEYDKNPLLTQELTTRNWSVPGGFADHEWKGARADGLEKTFIANLDSAIALIRENKFKKALGDVEDALIYVPKAKIDAEHLEYAADTVRVKNAADLVAPPLEKAQKVLEYLVASQGKRINRSDGQSRGQQ